MRQSAGTDVQRADAREHACTTRAVHTYAILRRTVYSPCASGQLATALVELGVSATPRSHGYSMCDVRCAMGSTFVSLLLNRSV